MNQAKQLVDEKWNGWNPELKRENRQNKLLHIFHVKNKSDYIIFYNFVYSNKKWHEKIARLKTRKKCIRMKKQKNFFIIFHPENLENFHCFSRRFSFRTFFWNKSSKKGDFFTLNGLGKLKDVREKAENLKRAVFFVFSERIEDNFRKAPASPWAKTNHWKTI